VRPKRPTAGKAKPGVTISGRKDGRDSEPTNRVTVTSESACRGVQIEHSLRGSIVTRQTGCRRFGFQFGKKGWNRGTV
jgi:hypothetical protein